MELVSEVNLDALAESDPMKNVSQNLIDDTQAESDSCMTIPAKTDTITTEEKDQKAEIVVAATVIAAGVAAAVGGVAKKKPVAAKATDKKDVKAPVKASAPIAITKRVAPITKPAVTKAPIAKAPVKSASAAVQKTIAPVTAAAAPAPRPKSVPSANAIKRPVPGAVREEKVAAPKPAPIAKKPV